MLAVSEVSGQSSVCSQFRVAEPAESRITLRWRAVGVHSRLTHDVRLASPCSLFSRAEGEVGLGPAIAASVSDERREQGWWLCLTLFVCLIARHFKLRFSVRFTHAIPYATT